MDLFSSIPQWVWGIAAVAFAAWYVFGRGQKKSNKRTLNQLRREDEATKRRLNITRNKAKIAEEEQKIRRGKQKDWLP